MSVRNRSHFALILVLSAGLVVACKAKKDNPEFEDNDDALVEDGTDTNAAETDSEVLTSMLVATTNGSLGLASAGDLGGGDIERADLGAGARTIFTPRGCVEPVANEAERRVIYKFRSCLGPNANVSGDVTVTYSRADNKLHLDLTATDLVVNRAVLDWHATADVTANGIERTMIWNAQLSGMTKREREFSRTTNQTVTWTLGEQCFTVSGDSTGSVRDRVIRTDVADLRVCKKGCPTGKITLTHEQRRVRVEILFDGTSTAKISGPRGEATLPLACRG
jgi:hypothetical protein